MAYKALVISVMIASPADVFDQREIVREVVNSWNFVNSQSRKLIIMPVAWETHLAPDLGGRPQAIINKKVLDECDLLVGIFWTRLGTPTGEAESGTVEEIKRHIDAGKPAMVYFSNAPVAPESINPQQYASVQEFKSWCLEKGIISSFTNSTEFRRMFDSQLQINLNNNEYLKALIEENSDDTDTVAVNELSQEATQLLITASLDLSGQIISFRTFGGTEIQTNGQTFGEPGNVRSAALWEAALQELIDLAYVTPRGEKGEVFQVTYSGYLKADRLKEKPDDRPEV